MNKFKQLWNDHIRLFFADLIMFSAGSATTIYSMNGKPWYFIALMIYSCILTSDILRSPITEVKCKTLNQ